MKFVMLSRTPIGPMIMEDDFTVRNSIRLNFQDKFQIYYGNICKMALRVNKDDILLMTVKAIFQ